MIRLGLRKKIRNSQTVISLIFRRNITLGHRFCSRKLSRKVNCWRAEFTGELSRSNGIKNWRLYLPTAYSWSKERREHFFSGN